LVSAARLARGVFFCVPLLTSAASFPTPASYKPHRHAIVAPERTPNLLDCVLSWILQVYNN
jgi:hypothetical protein